MQSTILGCGYAGKALLELWHNSDRKVVATTTTPSRREELSNLADEVVVVKSCDMSQLERALKNSQQLVVAVGPRSGESYEDCYLKTALALSDILPGTKVKQLVVLSTVSVYGECGGNWVFEDAPINPQSIDTHILYQTECVYQEKLPNSIETTILRLGGIFGPGREIENIVKRLSNREYAGSGESYSNWIHRNDIARAIDWAFEHHLSGLFNLCCDSHPRRADLYNQILERLNLPPIIWNAAQTSTHVGNRRVSNQKIKDTGFNFLYSP